MTQTIHSAIAVPECGSRYLLLRRREDDRSFPGRWCFPGGQVDDGDADEATAAVRELLEETGLLGIFPRVLHEGESPAPARDRLYKIRAFLITLITKGEVVLSDEHVEYRWVTAREGLALPLAGPFTEAVLQKLEQSYR